MFVGDKGMEEDEGAEGDIRFTERGREKNVMK